MDRVWHDRHPLSTRKYSKVSKYDSVLLKTAYNFAELSKCERLKVGAVIARDGRPLVTGYNGTISGTDNCCEEVIGFERYCKRCGCEDQDLLELNEPNSILGNICNGCNYCGFVNRREVLKTSDFVVHAEQNAIYYAARNGIQTQGCDIYITHAPCAQCAKAIASCGIKRVIYKEEYRDSDGIEFLKKVGVEVTFLGVK